MAGEWRKTTLDQLGRIITGKTPLSTHPEYFGGSIPFVTPTDFDGRRRIESTVRYLTEEGANFLRGCRIPSSAVMISCIGSDMGKAAIAGSTCITNQQINSIVVDSGDDPLFIYYNLSSRKNEIRAIAGGSAQPILNKSAFGRLIILLPPVNEQRAIAHILGTLDDKIELNRKMSEALEAIARAIFKSWFVDFDPVHAKMEGRQPTGMDAETAALFPDSFEDSELGKIPKGWVKSNLRDCCERIENGGTPKRSEPRFWEPATIPWLTSGEVRQDIVTKTINRISEEGLEGSSAKIWPHATTVVALYGATAGQVSFLGNTICANQACCGLIPQKNMRYYVYLHASSSVGAFEQQARGSAQQNLSQQIVADLRTVIPDADVLRKFDETMHHLFRRWIVNIHESATLAAIRDTLLPKLMSGELRI